MKKFLPVLLVLAMALSLLAGCGSQGSTAPAASAAPGSDAPANTKPGLVGFCSVSMSESIYVLEQQKLQEIFAGKWNIWVLFELGRHENMRFTELRKAIPGISNTVLTTTLRDLERLGLVNRMQYNEIPLHVEYTATESAKDLKDIYAAMWAWGEKHAQEKDAKQA